MVDSSPSSEREPLPRGLVLFPPGSSAGHRRRRLLFLAIFAVAAACLVWPILPLFEGPGLVFGLPMAMSWAIGVLAVVFVALVWLYRSEDPPRRGEG